MTSATLNEYVWKIENFSSLSSERHYSEVIAACGINWKLSIHPKGLRVTWKSPKGHHVPWDTKFVIGLEPVGGAGPLYVQYGLSIINLKYKWRTTKLDYEAELPANQGFLYNAMCLKELLDPKKGFIIDDICYIKVEIRAMKILKSVHVKPGEPEPSWSRQSHFIQAPTTVKEDTTQSREKKEILGSEKSGESKWRLNKNGGENEERNFALCRWFQEKKQNIRKYFQDDSDYQRLQQY